MARSAFAVREPTRAALDEQIAAEVAALPRSTLDALLPALQDARKELQRDLARWLGKNPNANERFTAYRYRLAISQMTAALKKISGLEPAMLSALDAGGRRAGVLATKHVVKQVDLYAQRFEGAAYPLPLDAAAAIAESRSFLIPRFRSSAARYAGNVRDDIQHQLAVGMLKGETIDELTDRLVKLGGPKGLVALRGMKGRPGAKVEYIAEGLFKRYRYWAERVVRTEVLSAYNATADASLRQYAKDDPEIKRRWNAAGDWRTCDICRGLDGAVAALGKAFPGGYSNAPAHPNCRCNIGPWKDRWEGAHVAEQKRKESEQTPEERIRDIEVNELAPRKNERLVAFDAAGKRLFTADGNAHRVRMTPEQARMLRGNRVTHNHPDRGEDYDSLSIADVAVFAANRAAMISAVATESEGIVRYSVTLKPNRLHPDHKEVRRRAERMLYVKANKKRAQIIAGTKSPLGAHLEALHETWEALADDLGLVYRREVLQPKRSKAKR